MFALDFEYDGRYLSDYGFIICDFNGTSGAEEITAGSRITFNKVQTHSGLKYNLTSINYGECLTTTFDICKDPELFDDLLITDPELRDLMRWLNRKQFLEFSVRYDDFEKDTCTYNASFNINKICVAEKLYGLRLTLETDSPFGHAKKETLEWHSTPSIEEEIENKSDELGDLFPILTITCRESGDFSISNSANNHSMEITDCVENEVLSIDCENQILISSEQRNLLENFNFDFFRLSNTLEDNKNRITTSLECDIKLEYYPIYKGGL